MILFFRNYQTFFQWWHHFTFPSAMHKYSNISISLPTLVIFLLSSFIIVNLVSVKWYLIALLICISLVISDLEYLCNLHTLFGEIPIQVIFLFFNCSVSFFCCSVVRFLYIFWTLNPYQIYDLQLFSPILLVALSFSW